MAAINEIPTTLLLIKGSTASFEIYLYDNLGNAEDISSAQAATFVVKEYEEASTSVLTRATSAANLSIDTGNRKLVGTLTQGEADALVPGTYIGVASLRFGATNWVNCKRVTVVVQNSFASHS